MKKLFLIITVLSCAVVAFVTPPLTHATLLFSDPLINEYNPLWQPIENLEKPVITESGITGIVNNSWSGIQYLINNKDNYRINFDIIVNNTLSDHIWGLGIGDSVGHWKILNTWQNSLQLRENPNLIERNSIFNWDHTIGKHHFEILISPLSNSPFTVIEDGKELITWETSSEFDLTKIWISFLGNNDYYMTNFALSNNETLTPTPTPEPTLTPTPTLLPTPTPLPTQTPTPTPSHPKKVIFLHGMGGSWNADALLNCKSSGYSGTWSPWIIKDFDIYKDVLDAIQNDGYTVLPYYYDWRKTTTDTVQPLKQYIQNNTTTNESFDLVGHSFGGLVGRAYINNTKENSHVDTFLTIGTPHHGSVFAYPAWSGGEMWLDRIEMRLGFTIMKIGCAQKRGMLLSSSMVRAIVPSIQNLLPLFDYLKDTTGQTTPVSTMKAKNNWLPDMFMPPYYGTTVGTITGTGFSTLRTLEVTPPNRTDKRLGNWTDGKPTQNITYADGDGTVLAESSQLPDVPNTTLPLDHAGLVTQPTGINAILNFLNGSPVMQPLQRMQAPNQRVVPSKGAAVLFIAAENAHFTLTDKDGNILEDSNGQISIVEPLAEAYTLRVTPTKKWGWHKTKILVVQLFEDGTSEWKEYFHSGGSRRQWKLRFDRQHKHNDILKDK